LEKHDTTGLNQNIKLLNPDCAAASRAREVLSCGLIRIQTKHCWFDLRLQDPRQKRAKENRGISLHAAIILHPAVSMLTNGDLQRRHCEGCGVWGVTGEEIIGHRGNTFKINLNL
jgi:hypothetical protein